MTTNEMIYKTINTKLTKEPKFKSVLEDMGYEVFNSDWSDYGNWTVMNPKTGRLVALSRSSRGGKRGIYNGWYCIKEGDISKVNLVGYLGKEKVSRKMVNTEYKYLRAKIKECKKGIKEYEDYLEFYRDGLDKWLKYYEEKFEACQSHIDKDNARLAEARARVDELRKGRFAKEIG